MPLWAISYAVAKVCTLRCIRKVTLSRRTNTAWSLRRVLFHKVRTPCSAYPQIIGALIRFAASSRHDPKAVLSSIDDRIRIADCPLSPLSRDSKSSSNLIKSSSTAGQAVRHRQSSASLGWQSFRVFARSETATCRIWAAIGFSLRRIRSISSGISGPVMPA
jgi:hypothetical protein